MLFCLLVNLKWEVCSSKRITLRLLIFTLIVIVLQQFKYKSSNHYYAFLLQFYSFLHLLLKLDWFFLLYGWLFFISKSVRNIFIIEFSIFKSFYQIYKTFTVYSLGLCFEFTAFILLLFYNYL